MLQSNKLTVNIVCSKLLFVLRARSSMVEQWPFKPLVQGSSPCALIFCLRGVRENQTGRAWQPVPPKKEYLHQLGGFGIRPYVLQNITIVPTKEDCLHKKGGFGIRPYVLQNRTIVPTKEDYLHKKGGFGTRPYILQIK